LRSSRVLVVNQVIRRCGRPRCCSATEHGAGHRGVRRFSRKTGWC